VHLLLRYTYFGRAQRAVAENLALARASGINAARVINRTWLLTGSLAGLAGYVLGISTGGLYPAMGFQFLLVVFAAAILGGIGQPYGAMAGALVVGVTMEVSALYISSDYKTVIAFGLLIAALLVRPQGLVAARRAAAG
jgi:branched-subunit amino acid ABC-type transport system permease component